MREVNEIPSEPHPHYRKYFYGIKEYLYFGKIKFCTSTSWAYSPTINCKKAGSLLKLESL